MLISSISTDVETHQNKAYIFCNFMHIVCMESMQTKEKNTKRNEENHLFFFQ